MWSCRHGARLIEALGTYSPQSPWRQGLESFEHVGDERFEGLKSVAVGDQHEHGEGQSREVLLELQVLICGQQDIEPLGRSAEEFAIGLVCPPLPRHGRDVMTDERGAKGPRE